MLLVDLIQVLKASTLIKLSVALESFVQLVTSSPHDKDTNADDMSNGKVLSTIGQRNLWPLLAYFLDKSVSAKSWPPKVIRALQRARRDQVAWDLLHKREMLAVLDAMTKAGIVPFLMKGTPLAYTHYPACGLRPRCDTDMLICKRDIATVFDVMPKLGYRYHRVDDLLTRQIAFSRKCSFGIRHVFDIHWRISNRPLFLTTLTYTEVSKNLVRIPELGENAFTLSPTHALLLACLHRVAEGAFGEDENLLWLYDIHLLLSAMPESELRAFVEQAGKKQIRAVCLDALIRSKELLQTDVPLWVIDALSSNVEVEPSARLLVPNAPRYRFSDLFHTPGLVSKFSGVLEALFPPAAYLLHYEQNSNRALLPVFYVKRIWRGLRSL